MSRCYLITAYCDSENKINALKNCINNLRKLNVKDICVYSHYPLNSDVQEKVEYAIYDYSNPVLRYPESSMNYWRVYKEFKMSIDFQNIGYAVLNQWKRGMDFLKILGYDEVFILNYDVIIDKFLNDNFVSKLTNNKIVKFIYDDEFLNAAILGMRTDVDLSFISKEEFINYQQNKNLKFLHLENFMTYYLKDYDSYEIKYDEYKEHFYTTISYESNEVYKINDLPSEISSPWYRFKFDNFKIHIGDYEGKIHILFFSVTKPINITIITNEVEYNRTITGEYLYNTNNKSLNDKLEVYVDKKMIDVGLFKNINSKIERLNVGIDTIQKLKIFQIELTSRCNATCSYCPHGNMSRKKIDMTDEMFEKALELIDRDNLWETFGNYHIELHSFGEPLLLGDRLFYFLNRMKEEKLPWSLSTNGILFGKNEEFEKKLLSYNGIIEISVENVNSKITLEDKYERINNFLQLHKQLNSGTLVYLISYGNVDYKRFDVNYGPKIRKSQYELHTWSEDDKPHSHCTFLQEDFFIIQSDGSIVGCCMDAEGENKFGTVFNPTFEKNKRWRKCDTCFGGLK